MIPASAQALPGWWQWQELLLQQLLLLLLLLGLGLEKEGIELHKGLVV